MFPNDPPGKTPATIPTQFPPNAYLPCPIKVPFEQAIHEYLFSQGSPRYALQIEGNANKNEADYETLIGARGRRSAPLLITPGVNQLFGSQFLSQVLDSGQYADAAGYPKDVARPENVLRDPLGYATVLAANVTLMVVDHSQLESRPVPQRWEDLLAPDFAGAVLMSGNGKRLPTPHPEVDSGLPVSTRYLWSGWERARSTDLSSELSEAEAAFASGYR